MVRPIPHEAGHTLTGKQRVRVEGRVFRNNIVILQVEESYYMSTWANHDDRYLSKIHKRWRDATVSDVTGGLVVCVK